MEEEKKEEIKKAGKVLGENILNLTKDFVRLHGEEKEKACDEIRKWLVVGYEMLAKFAEKRSSEEAPTSKEDPE